LMQDSAGPNSNASFVHAILENETLIRFSRVYVLYLAADRIIQLTQSSQERKLDSNVIPNGATESGETTEAISKNDHQQASQNTSKVLSLSPTPTPQNDGHTQAAYEHVINLDGTSTPEDFSSTTLQATSQRRAQSSATLASMKIIPLTSEPRLAFDSNYLFRHSNSQSIETASEDWASADSIATTRSMLKFATYVTATPSQAAKALASIVTDGNLNDSAVATDNKSLPQANAQEFNHRIIGFSSTPPSAQKFEHESVGAALGSAERRNDRILLTRPDKESDDEWAEVYRLLTRQAEAKRANQYRNAPDENNLSQTPESNSSQTIGASSLETNSDRVHSDTLTRVVVTDKVGHEDYTSMPILVLSQDDDFVRFELRQLWTESLNWMAIEYWTDFGWHCPSFHRVPSGKSQIFTAKCSDDGFATVSVFCQHDSFQGDANTPGYCSAPKGNKIATYFSLSCKNRDLA
jgi:hypothetical protein